jgi:hypothetical protein
MYPFESNVLRATAASVTDISHGVILALSALFLLMPFAMFVGLVYSGIRSRRMARRARS